ncbi:hypothetical protein ACQPXM_25095 [Kribbella sp. CA-253562]|uniref:hypothetical protein n=1 Tax=Kribbella sp. CA-253562 TaxID=3239942 RepID=UPI003D93BF8F
MDPALTDHDTLQHQPPFREAAIIKAWDLRPHDLAAILETIAEADEVTNWHCRACNADNVARTDRCATEGCYKPAPRPAGQAANLHSALADQRS